MRAAEMQGAIEMRRAHNIATSRSQSPRELSLRCSLAAGPWSDRRIKQVGRQRFKGVSYPAGGALPETLRNLWQLCTPMPMRESSQRTPTDWVPRGCLNRVPLNSYAPTWGTEGVESLHGGSMYSRTTSSTPSLNVREPLGGRGTQAYAQKATTSSPTSAMQDVQEMR